jgi:tetratricopeptide (TPR) repeat protein
VEWIEATKGFGAILDLLTAYREGLASDAALEKTLGQSVGRTDQAFDAWIKGRFAEPLKHLAAARDSTADTSELIALLRTGREMEKTGNLGTAIEVYEQADRMFPTMADHESPAWSLARLHRSRGDTTRALEYLARVTSLQETNLEANRLEGEFARSRGDPGRAEAAFERAIFISPEDPALHAGLAEAAREANDFKIAVRERQAILALRPTDRAEALYQLALAYQHAGDTDAARREVLKALEEAPSFERAQMLLLELRKEGKPR